MANKIISLTKTDTLNTDKTVFKDISFFNQTTNNTLGVLINIKAIQNSLHNIFTWRPGERILNPEFGSDVYKYLYEGITTYNTEQVLASIKHSISMYEPRITVEEIYNLTDTSDINNNTIHIQIIYSIPEFSTKKYQYDYIHQRTT